jgi:hypothetical protein
MDEKAPFLPHAPSVVSVLAVLAGVGIMVGGIALALVGAWVVSRFVPSPLDSPNDATRPAIMGPVQLSAPSLELQAFKREKSERLNGRGIDARTSEPFIPVEEAMKAMAAAAPSTQAKESQ